MFFSYPTMERRTIITVVAILFIVAVISIIIVFAIQSGGRGRGEGFS